MTVSPLDTAIISSLSECTINQIIVSIRTQHPELDIPLPEIENRVRQLRFETNETLGALPSDICQFNVFSQEEDYFCLLFAKWCFGDDEKCYIEEFRYLFSFHLPFAVIFKQMLMKRVTDFGTMSGLVEKYVTTFAQAERGCLDQTFTADELDRANVSDDDFRFWRRSFRSPPTRGPAEHRQIHPVSSKCALYRRQFDFLTQSRIGLAVLVAPTHVFVIQKKSVLIGGSECDLNITDLPRAVRFLIMLKNDLHFYMENVGEISILVNSVPIHPKQTVYLRGECTMKVSSVRALFIPNAFVLQRLRSALMAQNKTAKC
jgi:hypothetical protein